MRKAGLLLPLRRAVFEWKPRELIQAHLCRQLDAALVKDRNRRVSAGGAVGVQ